MSRPRRRLPFQRALALGWALSLGLLLGAPPDPAQAAPIYNVNSDQDAHKDATFPAGECRSTLVPAHPCTLRAAVETAAVAGSGATVNVPRGFVVTLALGALPVLVPMTITSVDPTGARVPGATVDGALTSADFVIAGGVAGVTISGLTVQRGNASGVINLGTVTLDDVSVKLNRANYGAGILNLGHRQDERRLG